MIDYKYSLGFFPTPLHELKNLSKNYPEYRIFIKRDDQTGLASGGNKTRKLEYLLQVALKKGCDTIITAGAQQSNHCRQTAAACAVAGLECHLLLGGEKPEIFDGNLLLCSLLGALIHFTGSNRKGEDLQNLKNDLEEKEKKCFIIPYGGSNFTGALGYVNAVKELREQLQNQNIKIDYIFFASSSGGTQAGIMLGLEMYLPEVKLVPISIDKDQTNGLTTEQAVLNIIQEGADLLKIYKEYSSTDVKLDRNYEEAGYGNLTQDEKSVIQKLATTEGILLDPVYTARAFYGMLDYLKKQKIPLQSNVLFWHTGGLPTIFKYGKELSEVKTGK